MFLGDKAFDADWLRAELNERGAVAVIPPKSVISSTGVLVIAAERVRTQASSGSVLGALAIVLAPVEHTAFIWATLLGWVVIGARVSPYMIEAATLLAGCLWASHTRKPAPVEAAMELGA